MRSCREPSCIGWPLKSSDQYCSWCGRRLVEVEALFEAKVGDEWSGLSPSVLNRERPPSLRLRVAHSGEAGHLRLGPPDFRLSAPWLELDYSSLGEHPLKPGEALHFPVRKLKVPGPEDLPHKIDVVIGQTEVRASTSLTFVPAPEFVLEMAVHEVVLASDSEPYVEAALVLRRGRIWLESVPELQPSWATLVPLDNDWEAGERLELDAVEHSRWRFRFHFSQEELASLRQRSADQMQPLVRQGKLVFAYADRGQRERLQGELALSLTFILAPELYVEPFGYELRRDWYAVLGLRHSPSFALTLHNGPPGLPGGTVSRQELVVQQLRVRDLDAQEEFPLSHDEPPPWKVGSDDPVRLRLKLPQSLRGYQGPPIERRLQLVPVSNDPVQRLLHLRLKAEQARPFTGYLVIDLGTSATCAALVSETKVVERLGPKELPSATCYLKLVNELSWEIGEKALRRSLEPAAQRAVVTHAKRRVGDSQPFEVVPLDEPGETVPLSAVQALTHIYRAVLDQALEHRLAQNTPEVMIEKVLITHPSRFSLRQVELLRKAAQQALIEHWQRWTGVARSDLPLPLTLHEPTGAAFHYLKDWRNLESLHQGQEGDKTWHLLVYDLGGGTLDCTLLQIQSSASACPGGFSFSVSPGVVGATGERWFGGQDVTLRLHALIWERLSAALGGASWPQVEMGGAPRVAALRNQSLLFHWCEQFKLELVRGTSEVDSHWLSFPALSLLENGRERLATASFWRSQVTLPSLEEVEQAVEPLLQASIERVKELLERLSVARPEVVLRVGKASQLPSVGRALAKNFPDSLQLAPEQLKGCVVEGACVPPLPGLSSGVQLSRGARRPGVRFRWNPGQSYTATTCRLGLQILDSGESWFQEVLPEGVPVPADGLSQSLDQLFLEPGLQTLIFLENAGREDALVLGGKANPDIQVLAKVPIEVPALPNQEEFVLEFHISPQSQLTIKLLAPGWEGQTLVSLDGEQMGSQY